ncbi:MAG: hypothetical protein JO118_13340 [Acetobacteraceae bacterium]|jgi:hypothetical protein|nr:hypothetical protein [Acetobacteraceae bacterium]MBV9118832.1 hypothetical protein [Acetobacteraceae bacterium]
MSDGDGSRRGALVALVVVAVLIVAAVLLTQRLRRDAAVQDCVAAGRRDCVAVDAGGR